MGSDSLYASVRVSTSEKANSGSGTMAAVELECSSSEASEGQQ